MCLTVYLLFYQGVSLYSDQLLLVGWLVLRCYINKAIIYYTQLYLMLTAN